MSQGIKQKSMQLGFFSKQLTLKRVCVLVAGILSVLLAGILPFSLYLSNALTFEGARYFGSFMFYGGLATCLYVGITTRFRVDWRLRKQAIAFGALMFCIISVFAAVEAPAVNALTPLPTDIGPNNSKAYKFSVPFTEYQWVVAQFRDGTYYAINGSDWNILTIIEPWQPVAPWASLATNKTALTQQVLSVTTAGKVLLNQLTYNYSLTIPANVTVVESYNGLEREFVSSANTQGSPYTISTDTVQYGYYLAQDKAGRYLDEWSSTDCTNVINNCTALGGNIYLSKATTGYTTTRAINIPIDGTVLHGEIDDTGDPQRIYLANGVNDNIINVTGIKCRVENLVLNGNAANQNGDVSNKHQNGIFVDAGLAGDFRCNNVYTWTCKNAGIFLNDTNYGFYTNIWNEFCAIGLQLQGGCEQNTFRSCNQYKNTAYQILLNSSTGNLYGNAFTSCQLLSVSDSEYGIYVNGSDVQQNTFSNTVCKGMGYSAVYLNGGYHNQFSSNDFYDCAIKTNKTYAVIHITGSSKYNNFNGGIYKSTTTTIPAYLYFEQNTACDYNLLSNWVATGLNANYSIQGVNTVNASNIFG